MKTLFTAAIAMLVLSDVAAAHEVWVERDGNGPARIYLGEPAETVPAAGDPEFPKLKAPHLLGATDAKAVALVRRANHIEAAVTGAGDVRLIDDSVFDPWAGANGKMEGVVYYARAGRSEASHQLDFEIVPVAAGSDHFTLLWHGKALPGAKVTVIDPDHKSQSLVTDAGGQIAVPAGGAGRYLLSASHPVEGDRLLGGKTVGKTYHISTLTYVAP